MENSLTGIWRGVEYEERIRNDGGYSDFDNNNRVSACVSVLNSICFI